MYPSRFRYEAPRSLDEVLALLRQFGDEAKMLAGGQSLVPLLKLRFASPDLLVDINGVPGLDHHREDPDGTLHIGALCRHADLERSALLAAKHPLMASAAPSDRRPDRAQPRHARRLALPLRPAGRLGVGAARARRARRRARPVGRRTIPVADFVVGPFQNALHPARSRWRPSYPPRVGEVSGSYLKLERRVGDFATAGVAVALGDLGRAVTRAGIALTGVGPSTIEATAAEQALVGQAAEPRLDRGGRGARRRGRASPSTDHRGSAAYKRHVVATFVRRGLARREVVAA